MTVRIKQWLENVGGGGKSYRDYSGVIARLDLNEPPFPPSTRVIEAVKAEVFNVNRYPEPGLIRRLVERLAEYSDVDVDNLVIGTGADLILQQTFNTVVEPGSLVVYPYPAFFVYDKIIGLLGGKPARIDLVDDGDVWKLPLEKLVSALESNDVRLVVIDNPNNPTGSLLLADTAAARRILDAASAIGALVVIDEAYYEFSGVTFAKLVDSYDNLVVVRTMSKAFALAGMRIGYAIASRKIAGILRKLLPPFPPRLSIVAALAALDDIGYSRKLVEWVKHEREWLRIELASIPGVKVYRSTTNFLLVQTPVENVVAKLSEKGVAVRSVPLGSEWMRISVGLHEENQAALEALRGLVVGDTRQASQA
ncbi:histidinol-phosphate transaminase [Hyperthermus butylicus]|uniref:histidinol-phosphate transaminase n=1 Tax=Hyperthermus butylicus (strain DSM 5456 / JCM 9403 / PLM1-5) TaxID=415426 RepID=A2BK39_HYPBU|nr:histidinol-phosphate transaminase [Hyperthermus butylicus]ABM80350.1 Histidinol-phosphate aminotransferase [Hyperthermus butylicus DSM 5456]